MGLCLQYFKNKVDLRQNNFPLLFFSKQKLLIWSNVCVFVSLGWALQKSLDCSSYWKGPRETKGLQSPSDKQLATSEARLTKYVWGYLKYLISLSLLYLGHVITLAFIPHSWLFFLLLDLKSQVNELSSVILSFPPWTRTTEYHFHINISCLFYSPRTLSHFPRFVS